MRTKSGVSGFGECADATPGDLATARAYWIGRQATAYAVVGPHNALSGAIEMVCHALVYRVLGGPTRAKVRALTSVAQSDVEHAAAAGHRAFSVAAMPRTDTR